MLLLQLLYTVRHALPQVHSHLVAAWSPALEGLSRQLEPLVRGDVLTSLLAQQLERERIAHYEARKASKKATQEAADLRAALGQARSATEKFRAALEKSNKHLQEVMIQIQGGCVGGASGHQQQQSSSSSSSFSLLSGNGSASYDGISGSTSLLGGGGGGGGSSSLLNVPNASFFASGQIPMVSGRANPLPSDVSQLFSFFFCFGLNMLAPWPRSTS